MPVDLALRARFNPELNKGWFGAVIQVINQVTMLSIILTGAALIREREHGTIEHLLVMPVTPFEIMTGKIWSMALVVLVGAGSGPAWEADLSVAAALAASAAREARALVLLGLPLPAGTPHQVLDAFAAADAAPPLDGAALHAALLQAGPGGTLVVVPGELAGADVAGHLPRLRQAASMQRCALVVLGA